LRFSQTEKRRFAAINEANRHALNDSGAHSGVVFTGTFIKTLSAGRVSLLFMN
jgi:hypothetical protein